MTLIRKLALALCLVLSYSSYSNSQTVDVTGTTVTDSVTGNLINKNNWTNAPAISGWQETCCTGGPSPILNADTNTIRFSYGASTVSQSIAVNQALQGTGIQVSGYKWGWTIFNQQENGGSTDVLYASVSTRDSFGQIIDQMSHNYSYQTYNWQKMEGTRMYNSPYQASSLSTISMEFVGQDVGYWAGYYGPRVRDPSLSLIYKSDPCATNPAYSSTCAGFDKIVNTNNLLDSSVGGTSLNQAFAINTALENAGIGATIHGFNYGFNWRVGESFSGCTATNQDGSCSWYMNIPSYAKATVSLTNNSSKPQLLYSQTYSFSGDGTSGSVSDKFLLPSSLNQSLLGTGRIQGSAQGTNSSIEGAWATMIYTADPCSTNPLYSPDCKGYASAIAKQIAASTPVAADPASLPPDPANPPPDPANPAPTTVALAPAPGSTPPPGSPPPPDASGSQQQSQQPPPPNASAPPPPGAPTTSAAPTATNPQPKPGEVQTAGSSKPSSSAGPSSSSSGPSALAMSVVASVQSKVNATEKATVQQANETAATATAQAVQMAESVAGTAQANSIASSMSSTTVASSSTTRSTVSTQSSVGGFSLQGNTQTSVVSFSALKPYTPSTDTTEASNGSSFEINNTGGFKNNNSSMQLVEVQQPQVVVQSLQLPKQESQQVVQFQQQAPQPLQPPQQAISQVIVQQQTQQPLQAPQQVQQPAPQMYVAPAQMMQSNVNYSLTATSNFNFDISKKQEVASFTEVEVPKTEALKMGTRSTLNDYLSEKPFMSLMGLEPTQDGMVKRNVQPNEAAGGVDIASIAVQPKGYDAYAQMTLSDAAFYKVDTIYKNQKTVDNVRLLRGLTGGSDKLHQEMVNQQYKGN